MITASVAAFLLALSPAVYAAGPDQSKPKPVPPPPVCKKKGYVYSPGKKKCVKTLSEVVPDEALKAQGWALAEMGNYEAAIELFKLVSEPRDAEALNGLGYSHRKLGRIEQGIAYYKQALAIAPDYVRAREYLGEGYVAAGKHDLAKAELREIGERCGLTCEEYVDLALAISTHTLEP
jgi:tetratricopeptide (TPR) repeat protein